MKVQDFVRQLNYPSRKIDGNFILNSKVDDVQVYIDTSTLEREELLSRRSEIITENTKKVTELTAHLLDEVGIDQWKTFKKKKRGRGWTATTVRGDVYAHYKKVFEDIKQYVPSLPGNIVDFGTSNTQYDLVYNNTTLHIRFSSSHTIQDIFDKNIQEIKRYEDSVAKENKHLIIAKDFLDENNEDYSMLITAKDIIHVAEEVSKDKYRNSLEGTAIEVQHSDGDDCTWTVGHSNRCECGHNRYYLEIEGNLVDGYYSWGQWC